MPAPKLDKITAELKERSELLRLKCKKAVVQFGSRLDEDLPVLLGRPCKVTCSSPEPVTQDAFAQSVAGSDSVWAVSTFERGSEGKVILRFPFEVGATLSGLLLVMADNRILEKVQERELTEEDLDVLQEVANQLRGILMRTFQKAVHRDVYLSPEYFIRSDELPETFPSGRACTFSVNVQIPALLDSAFDVAVDFDTLARLFGVNITAADLARLEKALETGTAKAEKPTGHLGTAVLIASDADAQKMLRAGIEGAGLRVARVPDFQELSNAVRSGLITAVIIDASGVAKGLKLARVLRSFSPRCAIVLGAAQWSREHVLESLKAGVDALLTQPYETDVVAKKIAQALNKRNATQPVATLEV
ncbi:MAG: hypothetical protein GXO73_14100 [Calditrichaeota bacterium]|nr:hypothetical protein [Calditrichota bacterium]